MKRSVRRYPLALLLSLLLLSGFTSFTSWAHQALGSTISKSANYLRQALTQPAKPVRQGRGVQVQGCGRECAAMLAERDL